jgi:hypothetical protein
VSGQDNCLAAAAPPMIARVRPLLRGFLFGFGAVVGGLVAFVLLGLLWQALH